jgi:uncharacterized membrane protein YfcA
VFDIENWIMLAIVVFVASLLQASTGFGFSIIGTPFLLMIYPAHTAIQINIILSLCISVFMLLKIGKEVDKPLMARLTKGSLVMLVPGLLLYLFMDIRAMKLIVGGLILLLTMLLITRFTIRQAAGRDYLTGGISGLLTTSIGVPGPPLLLYFAGAGTEKATLRSTTLAYYLLVYSVSLGMQIGFGGTEKQVWVSSVAAIPALLLGTVCGQLMFTRFSPKGFKILSYILLLFSGAYLVITSL